MSDKWSEVLKSKLNISLTPEKQVIFDNYARIFLEKNSRLNLISKNDERFLFEKHIFDSLAIHLFFDKIISCSLLEGVNDLSPHHSPRPLREREGFPCEERALEKRVRGKSMLDIGTGGGFPSVPAAILYDNLQVYPLDSIRKKINAIEEINSELKLQNLHPICDRAENIKQKFDYITTRAVAPVDTILKYAIPLLKDDGYFIAYKSKRAVDELKDAQKTIKHFRLEIVKTIEYTLPLEEVFERNLIIFKKKSKEDAEKV